MVAARRLSLLDLLNGLDLLEVVLASLSRSEQLRATLSCRIAMLAHARLLRLTADDSMRRLTVPKRLDKQLYGEALSEALNQELRNLRRRFIDGSPAEGWTVCVELRLIGGMVVPSASFVQVCLVSLCRIARRNYSATKRPPPCHESWCWMVGCSRAVCLASVLCLLHPTLFRLNTTPISEWWSFVQEVLSLGLSIDLRDLFQNRFATRVVR